MTMIESSSNTFSSGSQFSGSKMPEPVRVSADLPCGSIGNARVVDPSTVEVEVQSSLDFGIEGSLETWVCGSLHGHTGPVEVRVLNEHGNMQFLRPVARMPGAGWRHVSDFGRHNGYFSFTVPTAGGEAVDFASWWPYEDAHHSALLQELAQLPFVSIEQIGKTGRGRSLQAVVIQETDGPTLAVVSGFHGGEPSALWAADALLRFAASPAGAHLRRNLRIVAVPLVNLDAVAEGLDRRSADGLNLWLDAAARAASEVLATDAFLRDRRPKAVVDLHSWHWVGDGCYTPGWLATGEELYGHILALREAIDREFPLGGQLFFSDDLDCWLTRACVELGVPTIDAEITLSRGSDGAWKTLDRARQDGVAILRGAATFVEAAR
jgi:hypothetical protein